MQDGTELANWVQNELQSQLAHDLLTMYLRDDTVEDPTGVIALWQGLWNHLNDIDKERLWGRLKQAVEDILDDARVVINLRNQEDMVNFIVWPQSDYVHAIRDQI